MMRAAIDATPLLGQRSGVGTYVRGLLSGFAELPSGPEIVLTLFSIRGKLPADLAAPVPGRLRTAPRRAPARLLQRAWARGPFPPVELMTGRISTFHGTNFVLPPSSARGLVTIHDLAYLRHADTITGDAARYATLVPQALSRGAHVLAVSQAMADEVADEYGLSPDRLTVAHHGIHASWQAATPATGSDRTRLGLPERYVLFTGNLEPRKNLGTLVQAHRAARRTDPDVPPLVLVGPAGWGDRWQGSPPDPDDVVLAGYLSDEDLQSVVAGAVAVCMPSIYEGFGLPVLEAMATGRPVLASAVPAHREISSGLAQLVPPTDVDAWAHALSGVARDAPPAAGPGSEASRARRAHAAAFTWSASARRHAEAYRRAADEAA